MKFMKRAVLGSNLEYDGCAKIYMVRTGVVEVCKYRNKKCRMQRLQHSV
jgi:hypothetical protein